MANPLVNKKYLLEKIAGKGGWTFAAIPEVLSNPHTPFGWVKVKGSIDGFNFEKYRLMPMGNGSLFLPVKAEIRKKIKKQAGDYVHVILYEDDEPLRTPQEMLDCMSESNKAYLFYNSLTEGEQKAYIDWIYSAKKEETKIERMAETIELLNQHKKRT